MNSKNLFIVCALFMFSKTTWGQKDTIIKITLNEAVISANKFSDNKKYVAQPIHLISDKSIKWWSPQNSAALLEQSGSVFIQRSQAGGGSATIRGFEASRIQMVIDGVRMNNAIYRAGHLQNVLTIDNNILDRVEVLYGPASTLYGSDALGGVLVFETKKPQLADKGKTKFGLNAMTRYSSAYNEGTGHIDFNIGTLRIAFLTSVTYSSFGDLRQGTLANPFIDSFGLRYQYVERINGVDSIVSNANPYIQKQSGYNQFDILEKILFKQSKKVAHHLNMQYSNSSNIPRYDRLTEIRNGKLRYAEWYYGPQKRAMLSYGLNVTDMKGVFNNMKVGINYQNIEESRHQRNRGSNALQNRIEDVSVLGYNIDFNKISKRHELTFGADGQFNNVKSTANTIDIVTQNESKLDTRYPDGGNNMYYGAIYLQHLYKIKKDKLVLNDGVRLNYIHLKSKFTDTAFFPFPFNTAEQKNIALCGNLGLVYMPYKRWRFALSGSTGFRAPNIDDMTKVFESAAGTSLFVPNPDLKPEYTYNADLGVTYIVDNILKIECAAFYTLFRNAIVADKYTLNGMDSVMYGGKKTAVMASQNKAEAYLYGVNAAISSNVGYNINFYSSLTYTYGRYKNNGIKVPLDHIPPVYGKISIMYSPKRLMTEFYAIYNGWKFLKDYSPSGEDNLVYATPKGMPSWVTLNVRAGYRFNSNVTLQVALENIMDQNYRTFASGISSPGRNLVITLRGKI
ncbi:MAG: TonB-dependent receptor [Bacteroidetes bacterium]|nr:TonB-dependent receptor [Bacteroidota bacterium]